MIPKRTLSAILALPALCLAGTAHSAVTMDQAAGAKLDRLAQEIVDLQLRYDPTLAYTTGLTAPNHSHWRDRTPQARRAYEQGMDSLMQRTSALDGSSLSDASRRTYSILKEQLESERQSRICRSDLWAVSHMGGWQLDLVQVAQKQPVETPEERVQALERWAAVPRLVDQEIANLRRGLAQGYSAPRSVFARVIRQVDGLASPAVEKSPLMSPAERSGEAVFKAQFKILLSDQVMTAIARYRDFLTHEYLPGARTTLGVGSHPDGAACYQASLRAYTTLNRSAQQVHDIGAAAVARNAAVASELGMERFGTAELADIVSKVSSAPDNQFGSEEELIKFSREVVTRALAKSSAYFHAMPKQKVSVEPFRDFMRGSGASSYYEIETDAKAPAFYRIGSENWQKETRGGAEITAVHETYPGHHMQIAFAQTLPQSALAKLSFNSAYVEGWARYSEVLAEEAGIYSSPYSPITRRIWPARGMVADPGLHVLGWSREKTVKYLLATGRFGPSEAEDLVDRMAIMPGQLAAYDSGGLEILALREETKARLGNGFDIRDFHEVVLGTGIVPLGELRSQVISWIARKVADAPPSRLVGGN